MAILFNVTKQEFIFSNKFSHRLARHALFWIVWTIAFNLLFHFPIHVFKGWDLNTEPTANLKKLGIQFFFIKTLIINCFIAVILPQIFFTYFLLYYLIPLFSVKSYLWVYKLLISVSSVIVFLQIAIACKYAPVIYNSITGIRGTMLPYGLVKKSSLIDQFTSFPIVMGTALIIAFSKQWYLRQKKSKQLQQENLHAELRLLRAQINPHFLFNTINNIYFHTITLSSAAPELLKKLEEMMNYYLTECNVRVVPLQKEIRILQDYLALEQIRYGDKLELNVRFPADCGDKTIAPLLLIPLIENCFKHGASRSITPSTIRIEGDLKNAIFNLRITNTIPYKSDNLISKGHIGLKNVEKRLELLYPHQHQLSIATIEEHFHVILNINLDGLELEDEGSIIGSKSHYEMA